MATGEFISFIDSDDFLIGDISSILHFGESNHCDLIKFGSVWQNYDINQEHKYSQIPYLFSGTNGSNATLFTGYEGLLEIEKRKYWIPGCCWTLIKREYLEEHRIRFQENIIAEDQLFYLQLLTKSIECRIIEIPSTHYIYRRGHIHSISDRSDKQYVEEHFEMIELILKYMLTLPDYLTPSFLFVIRNLLWTTLSIIQKWNTEKIKPLELLYLNKWYPFIKDNYPDLCNHFDSLLRK